jgi:hypothetical protein
MPQPLSAVIPKASLGIYPEAAEKHPDRATQVASIFAWWSAVETQLGIIFAFLMGAGRAQHVLSFYHSLNSTEAKIGVVSRIVERSLPAPEIELFKAIRRVIIRPAQAVRNQLAHWAWAECAELPDAICLINPADLIDYYTESIIRPVRVDLSLVQVYREKDLQNAEAVVRRAHDLTRRFGGIISTPRDPAHQQLFEELCNEPLVREALDRQAEHSKTPREAS